MDDTQRYLFDLQGFIHIPGMLSRDQAGTLLDAAQRLERDAMACQAESPRIRSAWGKESWQSNHGYFARIPVPNPGGSMLIEDFWHFPDAFDFLIGHAPTVACVRAVVPGDVRVNNSELRIRYPGNFSQMHMGFPEGRGAKYRYAVANGVITCMMVRMIYFVQDVEMDQGVTCFVPGSHHGSFPMPVKLALDAREPGVVGVPVQAGDAIFFTENCRHGGFPNRSDQTRYSLHVGYGPAFMGSQNMSTWEEEPYATDALLARLSEAQRRLFRNPRHQTVV